MNIDTIMAELAQYIRMQEEAAAMVESLKDQLKERMTAAGVESLAGSEHKATYRAVTSGAMTPMLYGGSARIAAAPAASTGGSTPASSTASRTALTIDAHGKPCYNRHVRRCRP